VPRTTDQGLEAEGVSDSRQSAGSPQLQGQAMAGRERRARRGVLPSRLFAGIESGRISERGPEGLDECWRAGTSLGADEVEGTSPSALPAKAARAGSLLL